MLKTQVSPRPRTRCHTCQRWIRGPVFVLNCTDARVRSVKHIAVTLAPGSVVDFCDDCFNLRSALIEAVVKAHWIHEVAKAADLGQKPNRSRSTLSG